MKLGSVVSVLRRRGFEVEAEGDNRQLFISFELWNQVSNSKLVTAREIFGKKSFRKLSLHITSNPKGALISDLEKISGGETCDYLDLLKVLNVIEISDSKVKLIRSVDNIGPTLEWYVAYACTTKFDGSAAWSVKLAEVPYGDFDVLAWLPPTLLYVETKSSRPEEIEDTEIKHFLQRGVELAPDLAILLVDTDDDLEESGFLHKIYGLMLPTIAPGDQTRLADFADPSKLFINPQKGYPGISFGYRRFYVTNSKPSIEAQIRKCLRHFNARVKDAIFIGGPPLNFVTGEIEDF